MYLKILKKIVSKRLKSINIPKKCNEDFSKIKR